MIGRRAFITTGPLAVAGSLTLQSAAAAPTARERVECLARQLALTMAEIDPSRRNWRFTIDEKAEFVLVTSDRGVDS